MATITPESLAGAVSNRMSNEQRKSIVVLAFVRLALELAKDAHIEHLNARTRSRHMALDGLYKELPAAVDALAEAALGEFIGQSVPLDVESGYDDLAFDEKLEYMVGTARSIIARDEIREPMVTAIIDILQLCVKTQYLLSLK